MDSSMGKERSFGVKLLFTKETGGKGRLKEEEFISKQMVGHMKGNGRLT